jgi:polar amino acid transport system substrate-binding protein
MNKYFHSGLLVLLLTCSTHAVLAAPLVFITEAYPPYNFSDDNILRGIAVDILVAASQNTEQPVKRSDIQLLPWARGYYSVQKTPNTVLFSTTRTPAREKLFKWAGPIAETRVVLMARKDRHIKIDSPADLLAYRIGAIREDIGEQAVRALGVGQEQLLLSANADALSRQLDAGRIDLWAYEENVAYWFLRNAGFETAEYEDVYLLEQGELWFAFNLHVTDERIQQLQNAIDALHKTVGTFGKSRYDDILLNYL